MPVFTITISAAEGTRVMNALCKYHSISPPTQAAALQVLRQYIIDVVKEMERQEAVAAVAVPPPVVPT